ncbi:uncharacterized protein [Nicotiana sylvestris]|uniref:uncharacterized protein n=1 Tax=Nicotiana sylvestris TaxID=4096 RepID=UPI00388C4E45
MSVEEHHQPTSLKSLTRDKTQVNLGEASSNNQSRSQQYHKDIQHSSSDDGKKEIIVENQVTDQLGSSGNRAAKNGMMLTYMSPDIVNGNVVVKLDKEEVEKETIKWKNALIVYIIGEAPGYNYMKQFVSHTWCNVTEPILYLHEEGYYIVKFENIEDLGEVLYGGPYSINRRPMIVKQWAPNFDISNEFLTEILLWVTFPKLPMNCWRYKSLSKMASAIGKPLFADQCTANQTRVSYARILIEVNVTKEIPSEITMEDPFGRHFQQAILMSGNQNIVLSASNLGMIAARPRKK